LVGELVVDSLAAAGHAPIGFHLFQRVQAGRLPSSLLRGTIRELARNPDWKIRWFRETNEPREVVALDAALGSLPHLGRPGSDFIYPLMSQIGTSGVGAEILGSVLSEIPDVASVRRTLTRVAAVSMLRGDPAHAPYGWTHAFTMPQGALALAGAGVSPRTAVAVAMTFFAGFRVAYDGGLTGSLADDAASDYLSPDASMPDAAAWPPLPRFTTTNISSSTRSPACMPRMTTPHGAPSTHEPPAIWPTGGERTPTPGLTDCVGRGHKRVTTDSPTAEDS
jgi:hypothetical protein